MSVLDERCWNESYLIWATHLVTSFLFLSSNHPPSRLAPLPLRQPPAHQLNLQPLGCLQVCTELTVQSSELWMCEVEPKHEKYAQLRCSLQSAKQVYIDRMNCRPVFGVATRLWSLVCRRVTAMCVFQVGWAAGFPLCFRWQRHTARERVCVCVCVCVCARGAETTIGLAGLQQYNHLTQEDTTESREKNTQPFTHPSNPYFSWQDE